MRKPISRSRQGGMAMFLSLVILLLMSLIVMVSARSSLLELFLGNNSQHVAQALMRAEDSVIAGEEIIELNYAGAPPIDFSANDKDGIYIVGEIVVDEIDWSDYVAERTGEGDNYREYVIEYIGPATATGGSFSVGAGTASDTRFLYRVSGRGVSARGSTRVVQTIYATAE